MPQEADPERDAGLASANESLPPKLVKFRNIVGIDTPTLLIHTNSSRPAQNLGVYTRIVSEERKTHYQYYFMATLVNASTLLQTVVAAALTALGASSSSHIAITILGAVNTVIAGLQTYLKGQGLPNRLRQYQFGLRKLREYIEDRERDFSLDDCTLDVDFVIKDVVAMYKAVRQTAEDNTPDTYLPMGGAGKKLLGAKADGSSEADGNGVEGPSGGKASVDAAKTDPDGGEVANEGHGEESPATDGGTAPNETRPNDVDETEEAPLLHEHRN